MIKYKPGQLVTIGNHVFRIVRKDIPFAFTCEVCRLHNVSYLCGLNSRNSIGAFCNTIPWDCYLKPIK